jgi:hypothetical protein
VGTCEHLPPSRAPRPTDRPLALDQLSWSARRRARRRSLCECEAAAQVCDRHSCQPRTCRRTTILPSQADSGSDHHAARGPQRHVEPAAPKRGLPRCTDAFQDPARCGQRGRGHRTRVRPDTPIRPVAWTPVAWIPDVRPTSWTDVRTAERGRGQSDERRGRRPDILDGHHDGAAGWTARTSLRVSRDSGISRWADRRCPGSRTLEFLVGGHRISRGGQLNGTTPLPASASASRWLSPLVRTRWAWCSSRSTVAVASVLGMIESNPLGWMLEVTATERRS